MKLRTLSGRARPALYEVAYGRRIRPTQQSCLIEKLVLSIAYATRQVVGYKVSESSATETQLSVLRSHWARPTSPPKTALASLTHWMGRDRAGQGDRVKAVCRKEFDTPMLRTGFAIRGLDSNAAMADRDDSVPLGRVALPEDIADAVVSLASDAARCMCGALVEVNGGKAVA
ncbi:SDR family oxidoreductase [Mesorhizobium sp. M0152]|uniref:SDR family oxidoreductase n=1 Tax=Mesorhizobium sp. M0152 TaxID=2956898 RepID=UPI003339E9A2